MRVFKLIVPASLNYSESVRMVSVEVWEDAWFDKREKNMIKLVVDELFMNAVKYWSDEKSSIQVEWWFDWETVFFAIEDEWKWKKKIKAEDLIQIIWEEKDNTSLTKTHWRWLAQITWVMTSSFEVKNWKLWWIRIEFTKIKWEQSPEKLIKKEKKDDSVNLKKVDKKIFKLKWEIDLYNLDEVSRPIDDYVSRVSFPVEMVLDCKDLKFFNSTFIWKIAEWHGAVSAEKWELKMINVSNWIFEILDMVWLTKLLNIEV